MTSLCNRFYYVAVQQPLKKLATSSVRHKCALARFLAEQIVLSMRSGAISDSGVMLRACSHHVKCTCRPPPPTGLASARFTPTRTWLLDISTDAMPNCPESLRALYRSRHRPLFGYSPTIKGGD